MSGNYFGGFTPGATQYGSTFATPTFPSVPYGFTPPAATGYATAFQQAPGSAPRPEAPTVFAYSRPDAGYVGGAAPIYASPLTAAAASGVAAASVIAGLSAAAATKSVVASSGSAVSSSTKPPSSAAGTSSYTGYDAAVYAAATSYLQSKASGGASQWLGLKRGSPSSAGTYSANSSFSGGRGSFPRKTPSISPRTMQLHYCDVCKISCAGPQTYKEHLEGQKHKKKEALARGSETQPLAKSKASFRCDLCSVTCTGQDTYNAHVRGAKHQKTLKLHQTLGKPIPSGDPVIIPPSNAQRPTGPTNSSTVKKVVGVPKVEFIGGQKLTTTGMIGATTELTLEEKVDPSIYLEKEVQPVGEDYVILMKAEDGKSNTYFCKLCDCKFNDMNAKDMHLKGRRHRLQFKKKVNPALEVDIKPTMKDRRISEERQRKEMRFQRDLWSNVTSPMMQGGTGVSQGPVPLFGGASNRQTSLPNDLDDQYIFAKHASIYPSDDEMKNVLSMVTNVERALKRISDHFASKIKIETDNATELNEDGAPKQVTAIGAEERLLKGAMRVGSLATGLMLRGDPSVQLVVLCSEKPTRSLLAKVAEMLPEHLAAIMDGSTYDVGVEFEEAAINVTSIEEKITVVVVLTSIYMREPVGGEAANKPEPIDVLDRQKCLEALASLRQAKWFQARCAALQSCPMILRLFRDMRQRLPSWMALKPWPCELLVEKVMSSAGVPLGPAEALRRVFEALASGILMPGGPGIQDPCEKETVDATASIMPQQREDITSSAQLALRLMAWKQIYKVLGVERSIVKNSMTQRKRPIEQIEESANGKKDKKEDEETMDSPDATA